jgi:hypothetical protein
MQDQNVGMEAQPPEALAVRQLLREGDGPQTRRRACAARNIPESYKGRTRSLVMAVSLGQPELEKPCRLFQTADPIPQWLQIVVIKRQSANVFIKIDRNAGGAFCLFETPVTLA